MAAVTFEGRDLAEAIAAAADAMGLPPEKLKFSLADMGSRGFLGLGRRRARVSVDPDDPALLMPDDEAPPAPEEKEEEKEAAPARQPRAAAGPASPRPLDFSHLPPPLTRPAAGETTLPNPDDEPARLTRAVLRDILDRLGLSVGFSAVRLGDRLVLNLDGPDRDFLIGPRGVTLDALQLLTAKIAARKSPEAGRLVLDAADYRFSRRNQVLELIERAAEAARAGRRPQTVSGLTALEKRLARLALKPCKDLAVQPGGGHDALVVTPAHSAPAPPAWARRRR